MAGKHWRADLTGDDGYLFSPSSCVSPEATASAAATVELANNVGNGQLQEDLKGCMAQVDPLRLDSKEEKEEAKEQKREKMKEEKSVDEARKKRQMRWLKQLE